MTAEAFEPAPDFHEALEGWRVWRVIEREGQLALASVVKRTIWRPGEPLIAECLAVPRLVAWMLRRPRHDAPRESCGCGVYATGIEWVGEYLTTSLPEAVARVIGRVALWGTVIECERGFRASHGYPLALYVPVDASPDPRLTPEEIAVRLGHYAVPVEVLPSRRRDTRAIVNAVKLASSA